MESEDHKWRTICFASSVLNYLVEHFGIAPITAPEEDLKQLLG